MKAIRSILIAMTTIVSLQAHAQTPLNLSASDMISKVYGLSDSDCTAESLTAVVTSTLNITPEEEDGNLWLDSDAGYNPSYCGMTPDVMAVACFSGDRLVKYAYFFIFPYAKESDKELANATQARFCGCLLQELHDMGLDMCATLPVADETPVTTLFSTSAPSGPSMVDVTLRDHATTDVEDGGKYVLTLSIDPGKATGNTLAWTE